MIIQDVIPYFSFASSKASLIPVSTVSKEIPLEVCDCGSKNISV